MTQNGHEHNKEHMHRITEYSTVSDVIIDFEKDWLEAEPLTQELIDTMVEKSAAKIQKQKSWTRGRGSSRSQSLEMPVRRSLTGELSETAHPD